MPLTSPQAQLFVEVVQPVAPPSGTIARGGTVNVVDHGHTGQPRRRGCPPVRCEVCGRAAVRSAAAGRYARAARRHGCRSDSAWAGQREAIDVAAEGIESVWLHTGEPDVEAKFGQSRAEQVLNAFRSRVNAHR